MKSSLTRLSVAFGAALFLLGGCARMGQLPSGTGRLLARDSARLPPGDPGRPGSHEVVATGWSFHFSHGEVPVVLYRPRDIEGRAPAVVFIPGRASPEDQYESYGRLLASQGFVVLVRGGYGFSHQDATLVREIREMGTWLSAQPYVDPNRLGVAGHSMGGRNAIVAAAEDSRFKAVVGIDPGSPTARQVIEHVVGTLRVPLLLIGAEVGWRAMQICSTRATNYEQYFREAPPGTIEVELRNADHVQLMDEPDRFGMFVCRSGSADSTMVRTLSRRATAAFLTEHLAGGPHVSLEFGNYANIRVRANDKPVRTDGASVSAHPSAPAVQ